MFAPALLFLSVATGNPIPHALDATPWIESQSPRIQALVSEITAGAADDREKAVRLHDFVRDEIRFGWTRRFYRMKATEVLDAGVGYCNTKATLFVALLRAAGIPARQHFVNISSRVLEGFLSRGEPYVDHSFTEVFLDGRWLRLDSYVVDRPLYDRARRKLAETGQPIGFGIHAHGSPDWDGRSDRFVQLVDDGLVPDLTGRDHGVFADTAAFYREAEGVDELSGLQRFLIPLFIPAATARAEALRTSR